MKKMIMGLMVLICFICIGTVKAYSEYKIGDKVKINDEEYYVIKVSNSTDQYVVALKATPLTLDELNTYGSGIINKASEDQNVNGKAQAIGGNNDIGGMAFYTKATEGEVIGCYYIGQENNTRKYSTTNNAAAVCKNDYASSDVKTVVDNWVNATFENDQLSSINGYKARLITVDELKGIVSNGFTEVTNTTEVGVHYTAADILPDWVSGENYDYWTMDAWGTKNKEVWGMYSKIDVDYPSSIQSHHVAFPESAVRPVVNINKTYLEAADDTSSETTTPDANGNVKVEDTLLQKSLIGTIIGLVLIGLGITTYLIAMKLSYKKSK